MIDRASGVLPKPIQADVTTRLDCNPTHRLLQRRTSTIGQPEHIVTLLTTLATNKLKLQRNIGLNSFKMPQPRRGTKKMPFSLN